MSLDKPILRPTAACSNRHWRIVAPIILLDTAPTPGYGEEIEANARLKGATQEQLEALDASAEDEAESWRMWSS